MDGERQQPNSNVNEIDSTIASNNSHVLCHNHHDEVDQVLGDEKNVGNFGDAAAANSGGMNEADQRTMKKRVKHGGWKHRQLESAFWECAHPDEKQRLDLSRRLDMSAEQVKHWFQNRRSAEKTRLKRRELKDNLRENERLQVQNKAIRLAIETKKCRTCAGPLVLVELTPEQRHLRAENARLKAELLQAASFLRELSGESVAASIPMPDRYGFAVDLSVGHSEGNGNNTALFRHVLGATKEFMMLVDSRMQMFLPTVHGEVLDNQRYAATMSPGILGARPMGFVPDGTRETALVMGTALDVVHILTDTARFSEVFQGIVAGISASNIITVGTSLDGQVQLIDAELMVLSQRVPVRKVKFIRYSKMLRPNLWAVVDVSIDGISGLGGDDMADLSAQNNGVPAKYTACRLLPSGCLIEDMNNGCKVTWIVNAEYDETTVPRLYRPLLRSGQALGARRWLASLQRKCEYLAVLHSSSVADLSNTGILFQGRKNVLELAQGMMARFYEAMCKPADRSWSNINQWCSGRDVGAKRFEVAVRVETLGSGGGGEPGEQAGRVLSATTTVWFPGVPAQRVFHYLCDRERRGEWDTLAYGAAVQEEGCLITGQLYGNNVYILRPNAADGTNSNKLILQETCADASCLLLSYAPIDEESMHQVMNGNSDSSVSLLPSGFVILPDGYSEPQVPPTLSQCSSSAHIGQKSFGGSLVTFMYQTLLSALPSENLSAETADNIRSLIYRAINKIKSAVYGNIIDPAA